MTLSLFLLIVILVFICVSIHLAFVARIKKSFDKVIFFSLVYALVHTLHTCFVYLFSSSFSYIALAAPYGLLYGPILYWGIKSSKKGVVTRIQVKKHLVPFLLFFPFYLLSLFSWKFRSISNSYYPFFLYGVTALSWYAYSLWSMFSGDLKKGSLIEGKILIKLLAFLLFILAIFLTLLFVNTTFFELYKVIKNASSFIFFCLLVGVILVYIYIVNGIVHGNNTLPGSDIKEGGNLRSQRTKKQITYQKSQLPDEICEDYLNRLNQYMDKKPYLDPDFNLDQLAKELKMYKHHCSQLLNKKCGQNFSTYVNLKRLEHACFLLTDSTVNIHIEDIAENCGFKSKASFYRNFNGHIGCTPTEYRRRFIQ